MWWWIIFTTGYVIVFGIDYAIGYVIDYAIGHIIEQVEMWSLNWLLIIATAADQLKSGLSLVEISIFPNKFWIYFACF